MGSTNPTATYRQSPADIADIEPIDLAAYRQEFIEASEELERDALAVQEKIAQDVRAEFLRARQSITRNYILVSYLAAVLDIDRTNIRKRAKALGIPVYKVRFPCSQGNVQEQSAVDRVGALRIARYYGGEIIDAPNSDS